MRHTRPAIAVVAAFSLGFAQGCARYAYPRPFSLPPGVDVAIRAGAQPMQVVFAPEVAGGARDTCHASHVTGYSTALRSDTVRLAWVAEVTPVVEDDPACRIRPAADVIVSSTTTLRTDDTRAAAIVSWVIVITAVIVIVALVAKYTNGPLNVYNPNAAPQE